MDEGAKVWCAAWDTDPALVAAGQERVLLETCKDFFSKLEGMFPVSVAAGLRNEDQGEGFGLRLDLSLCKNL